MGTQDALQANQDVSTSKLLPKKTLGGPSSMQGFVGMTLVVYFA